MLWRVDSASRDIDRPCGDVFSRQISADSVEPTIASRSRNLLSHKHRNAESPLPGGTDAKETIVFNMFRVENGKLAEHWDSFGVLPDANP